MRIAAAYIRVSTHMQEELSPDAQKRLLGEYAKRNGMILSNEFIFMDKGISGKKAEKRPDFMKMISMAKQKPAPFDVILVWKFSRFARNQEESIVYKNLLRNKCKVSSFDTDLMNEMGKTLGEECQAENLSVLLGPAVNIKRSPLCGRNFEYLSEDPYLAGKMAASYIRGVQSWDVGTSMKHYAANNQEYNRMSCSSNLSERTFREIYLPTFETAVKEAQPKTIMCSYNKINGVYASENKHLLTEILRDEWGFEGYVMTDWGAVADRVKGIVAGLDLEMPGSHGVNDARIIAAVKDGSLDEALLDKAVERILKVLFSYADNRHPEAVFDRDADHEKSGKNRDRVCSSSGE